MKDQDSLALVKQAYSLFQNNEIEPLLRLMSDDIEWDFPQVENVPFSGKRRGIEQVREFFRILASEQDVLEFNPREYIAQGEKVVCLGNYKWKTKEGSHEYGSDWAHVFEVRNGKVAAFHEYMDTAAAANAYKKGVLA